jgi:transcriptional regulator with XRE-family HTH domain
VPDDPHLIVGPIGCRLAVNVRVIRRVRGLRLADLADRLCDLGNPIRINGLSKIENRDRRVDVDDLIALAAALDVHPLALLATPKPHTSDALVALLLDDPTIHTTTPEVSPA